MPRFSPMIERSRVTAQLLGSAVELWMEQLNDLSEGPRREVRVTSDVATTEWIDLHDIHSRIPERYLKIENEQTQKLIVDRFRKIDVSCVAANASLLKSISRLAFERASYNVLIDELDTFEVSPWSICCLSALANLWLLINKIQRSSEEECLAVAKKPVTLQKQVSRPLLLAQIFEEQLLPGDLWIADLVAHSVVRGIPELIQKEQHPVRKKLLQRILPGLLAMFVSNSPTQKLLVSHHLPKELLKRIDLSSWSGNQLLMLHPGATSLRTYIGIESTQLLSVPKQDKLFPILTEFVKTLCQTELPEKVYRQRFVANLLIDWLSIEKGALERFATHPAGRMALHLSVQLIESHAESTSDSDIARSVEVSRKSLRQFSLYQQIRSMNEQLTAAESPTVSFASTDTQTDTE